jgi:multidrug resistance efflux pump
VIRSGDSRCQFRGPAVRGPLVACGLAVAGLAAIAAIAALLPMEKGFIVAEARVVEGAPHQVSHPGGAISKVHVASGRTVVAGELLATVGAFDLDAGIEELKDRLNVARRQQDALRLEIQAFKMLLEQKLIPRQRVVELEREVARLETETAGLMTRIGQNERRLSQAEIRAPVSGVLVAAPALLEGRDTAPGAVLAEIFTDKSRMILEARLSKHEAAAARKGDPIGVLVADGGRGAGHRASARLVEVAPLPDAHATGRSVRLELDLSGDAVVARAINERRRVRIIIGSKDISIAQQLVSPLRRALTRSADSTSQPGV